MSPDINGSGSVRPAELVNEDIRALARAAWGRPFNSEESAAYARLVVEWTVADRAEVPEAA